MTRRSNPHRANEVIKLFRSAAGPVSHVRMLAVPGLLVVDQVVLAGDQPLHPASAVHVLVAGVLNRPLSVLPWAVPTLHHSHRKNITK